MDGVACPRLAPPAARMMYPSGRLQSRRSTGRDRRGQIRHAGNLNVFGFLTGEDYNQDLDGFPMFATTNKMRLSDAQGQRDAAHVEAAAEGGDVDHQAGVRDTARTSPSLLRPGESHRR